MGTDSGSCGSRSPDVWSPRTSTTTPGSAKDIAEDWEDFKSETVWGSAKLCTVRIVRYIEGRLAG